MRIVLSMPLTTLPTLTITPANFILVLVKQAVLLTTGFSRRYNLLFTTTMAILTGGKPGVLIDSCASKRIPVFSNINSV